MSDEEIDSRPETLSHLNNAARIDEVQGEWELDELVDDLHKEWSQHEGKMQAEQCCDVLTTSQGIRKKPVVDGAQHTPATVQQTVL